MLALYKNIKKIRTELKMSQAELANKTGYTDRSSIAKIENGLVDLPFSKILQFSSIFHISPLKLIGETQEKELDWNNLSLDGKEEDPFKELPEGFSVSTGNDGEFILYYPDRSPIKTDPDNIQYILENAEKRIIDDLNLLWAFEKKQR